MNKISVLDLERLGFSKLPGTLLYLHPTENWSLEYLPTCYIPKGVGLGWRWVASTGEEIRTKEELKKLVDDKGLEPL